MSPLQETEVVIGKQVKCLGHYLFYLFHDDDDDGDDDDDDDYDDDAIMTRL